MWWTWIALACTSPPPAARVEADGVRVAGDGLTDVAVYDGATPRVRQRWPAPVDEGFVAVDLAGLREVVVRVVDASGTHELRVDVPADRARCEVRISAPIGAPPVVAGADLDVERVGDGAVDVAVHVRSAIDGEIAVTIDGVEDRRGWRVGERGVFAARVGAAPVPVTVDCGERHETRLTGRRIEASGLRIGAVVFPAEVDGAPDLARPTDRVSAWPPAFQAALRRVGLGGRDRDPWTPWGRAGVEVINDGDRPRDVVVDLAVLDPSGAPSATFRPRMRDGEAPGGRIAALLRVPPGGSATAVLPVFVDDEALDDGPWTREARVSMLGTAAPLDVARAPVYASRRHPGVAAGFGLALVSALVGHLWLARRIPGWLAGMRVVDLLTITSTAAVGFWIGAAGQILALGLGAVLGPFSPFVTGIVDDALRTALLAALLTVRPQVGTASLAVVVGWLLNAVALGAVGPADVVFVGSRVLWLEGALWAADVTRTGAWATAGRGGRIVRLAGALAAAGAMSSLLGSATAMVLYRLWLAEAYVLALALGPGALYPALAAALAVPFADALRQVRR